jgi:hypothetical protein
MKKHGILEKKNDGGGNPITKYGNSPNKKGDCVSAQQS